MKSLLSLSLILIINITINAQSIHVSKKESEIFKSGMAKRNSGINLLGKDENFVYYDFIPHHEAFGRADGFTTAHYIAKVSTDLNTIIKNPIDYGKKNNYSVKKIVYLNNQLYAIKIDGDLINAHKINKNDISLSGKHIELMKTTVDGSKIGNLSFITSKDQSKLMIFYFIYNSNNVPKCFGIRVYDEDLELMWVNEHIKPKFKNGIFNFENFSVQNNGEVYFIGAISQSGKKATFRKRDNINKKTTFRIDNPGEHFQIYHLYDEGEEIESIELDLNLYYIRDMNYDIYSGKLWIYGVYCTEEQVSALGTFIAQVNIDNETINEIEFKKFSEELISRDYNKKEMAFFNKHYESDEWDGFHYKISKLKTRKDGSYYFVSEKWLRGIYGDNNVSMTDYLYEDLYITSVEFDKGIEQNFKISKRQYAALYNNICSYNIIEGEKGSYFIYNNFNHPTAPMQKNGITKIVLINSEGSQTEKIIEPEIENSSRIYHSTTFVQLSPMEFMIGRQSLQQKFQSYVKMKIEE
jgi:hypothetical protein